MNIGFDILLVIFLTAIISIVAICILSARMKKQIASKETEIFVKRRAEERLRLDDELNDRQNDINVVKSILNDLDAKVTAQQTLHDVLKSTYNDRERELKAALNQKIEHEKDLVDKEVKEWMASAQEAAEFYSDEEMKGINDKIADARLELGTILMDIDDYKAKQSVINEAILREREVAEKEGFYSVQVPEESQQDISIINSIRNKLSKVESLDKLIYDNYIKKSVDEMIQRVLQGRASSGIYKITRRKTGEIYIGKSTDIKKRWQQHCKTCFHCGTISESNLHRAMRWDGLWNFTFELLEEVPKEKLTEREKYWIQFYNSKTYGLNEREG